MGNQSALEIGVLSAAYIANQKNKHRAIVLPGARVRYNAAAAAEGFGTVLRAEPHNGAALKDSEGNEVYARDKELGTVVSIGEDTSTPEDMFFQDRDDGLVLMQHNSWAVLVKMDRGGYLRTASNERFVLEYQGKPNNETMQKYGSFLASFV